MFFVHDNVIKWLNSFFQDRLSSDISFSLRNHSQWILSVKNHDFDLVFPVNKLFFIQSYISNFPCSCLSSDFSLSQFLPDTPLPLPGISSFTDPILTFDKNIAFLRYDIPGFIYWTINRIEEVYAPPYLLDHWNRFPAFHSHSYHNNYLLRPIVDEWIISLKKIILYFLPRFHFNKSSFDILVSHDVDVPLMYGFRNKRSFIRSIASSIIKNRDFISPFYSFCIYANSAKYLHPKDPYNTFDFLFACANEFNYIPTFYFMAGNTEPLLDANYSLDNASIENLLIKISSLGFNIGIHPSFNSFQASSFSFEVSRLRSKLSSLNIYQPSFGSRMHCLRWDWLHSLQMIRSSNLDYDSTLGFADSPGFRCGTCHPFKMYDVLSNSVTSISQLPLIFMECSAIDSRYLGLGYTEQCYQFISKLKYLCMAVEGNFSILWHNSHFNNNSDRDLFRFLLSKP